MIALVEGAERQKTPNEIALNILLAGLTIVFLIAVVTLQPLAIYSGASQSLFVLVALLVCLIPTTIGGLLVGHRHRRNGSPGAAQRAGDVGARRRGRRRRPHAAARQDRHDHARQSSGVRVWCRSLESTPLQLADAAQLASLADETPEGRSIVVLVKERYGLRGRELAARGAAFVPFTAHTRMSGVDFDGRQIRKGASDAIEKFVATHGGSVAPELRGHGAADRPLGRHAARRRRSASCAGCDSPQGRRQGRDARALQRAARDGHQDDHDHRRQPADRRRDRGRSRRRRLPGRSHARRQDGADQARAGRREAGRDDRRRHQRCARARSG